MKIGIDTPPCRGILDSGYPGVGALSPRRGRLARGWVAVVAAIFGFNHPIGVFFTGMFFGFTEAFAVRVQTVSDLPPNLIQLIPQFATLLALVLVGLREKLSLRLTKNSFRQELELDSESPAPTPGTKE